MVFVQLPNCAIVAQKQPQIYIIKVWLCSNKTLFTKQVAGQIWPKGCRAVVCQYLDKMTSYILSSFEIP